MSSFDTTLPKPPPTEAQILAWIKANPQATDAEIRAYATGTTALDPGGTTGALGTAVGLGRGAANTLSFGLGDEIVGTIEGALRPGMSISEGIAGERAINKSLNPIAYGAGQLGGGLLGGLGATKLALTKGGALVNILTRWAGGGFGSKVALGAASGAVTGGAEAFGQAEGNPLERLPETLMGAGAGMVIGGGIPMAGSLLRTVGNATGIRPRFVDPATEAANLTNAALRRDATSPMGIAAQAAKNPTVPQAAVDLAGDNTKQLALAAQSRSSTARRDVRDLVERRIEGARDRHVARLEEVLNPEHKDILEVAKELSDLRSRNAKINFARSLDKTVSDPELAAFMREPEVREAYEAMVQNALTKRAVGIDVEIPPAIYDADGRMVTIDIPVRVFHFAQRAVHDAITAGLEKGTIKRDRALMFLGTKDEEGVLERMMTKVETAVPEYGAAREVYRNDSAAMLALKAGSGKQPGKLEKSFAKGIPIFGRSTNAEMAQWLGAKRIAAAQAPTESARDAAATEIENYMLGAISHLRDQLDKSVNYLNSRANRERIRILMGGDPQKADEFISALRAEREIRKGSRKLIRTDKIPGGEGLASSVLDLGLVAAGASAGRSYATLASLGRLIRGEHRMTEATADATLQNLFAGVNSFEELVEGMRSLRDVARNNARRTTLRAGRNAGLTTGLTGTATNEER